MIVSLAFFWLLLFTSSTWHDYIMLGCKRLTVFSYKIRIVYLLLIKIFPTIKFRFLSWIVVRYRTDVSHHSGIYLAWCSLGFLCHFYIYNLINSILSLFCHFSFLSISMIHHQITFPRLNLFASRFSFKNAHGMNQWIHLCRSYRAVW